MPLARIVWIYVMLAACLIRSRALYASLRRVHTSFPIYDVSSTVPTGSCTPLATEAAAQIGTVMAKSGLVRQAYLTLTTRPLFESAHLIIVEAPTPETFQFPDTANAPANHRILYSARLDDITTEEVIFGRVKEQTNKARLNKFIGGRIALRRALNIVLPPEAAGENGSDGGSGSDGSSMSGGSSGDGSSSGSSSRSSSSSSSGGRAAETAISESGSILRDDWGAPNLAPGVTGSISHKDFFCVGAAALDLHGRVGVDLEHINNKAATTLWRRILTAGEKEQLGGLRSLGFSAEEEVLLIFSFKEAVYKAIHPFLARSIDFGEVEIFPHLDGSARVVFGLRTGEQFDYQASWERFRSRYWLTCVYVRDPSLRLDANAKYSGKEDVMGQVAS